MIYKQTHTYEIISEILPEWCHAYEDLESDNPAQTLRDYYGKDVDGNEMLKSNLALKFVVYNFKTMRSATYSSLKYLEPEFTNQMKNMKDQNLRGAIKNEKNFE